MNYAQEHSSGGDGFELLYEYQGITDAWVFKAGGYIYYPQGYYTKDKNGNIHNTITKHNIKHVAQSSGDSQFPYANALKEHYENGNGGEYVLSENQVYELFNEALINGAINWNSMKQTGTHSYDVSVNFYKTNLDLALAFGRATMNIHIDPSTGAIFPQAFHDTWNLDPKDWGIRSYHMEAITRFFNSTLTGTDFYITYP